MSKPCSSRRLPKNVIEALEGLDWKLVPGKKHVKLTIAGTVVTVMSHGHRPGYDRPDLTIIAAIKKFKQRG